MKIFEELKKLDYKHYTEHTIEELDNLPLDSEERIMEQALVFRWFREKYEIDVFYWRNDLTDKYRVSDIKISNKEINLEEKFKDIEYKTFEEAELACLVKLIEIVNKTKYSSINAPTYYN
jgi:hypothetical protein